MPWTCPAFTERSRRCGAFEGLNYEGYCAQHAAVCPGTSPASGVACKIRCGLIYGGYCAQHRFQAPGGIQPTRGICRGVTEKGMACTRTKELDTDDFCKFHRPNNVRCRALKGRALTRCKCRWGVDADGFCEAHAAQRQRGRVFKTAPKEDEARDVPQSEPKQMKKKRKERPSDDTELLFTAQSEAPSLKRVKKKKKKAVAVA